MTKENTRKWIWLITATVFAVLPIILIKYAIQHKDSRGMWIILILGAILFEICLVYAYYHLFQLGSISTLYSITKGIAVAVIAISGVLLFKEHLTIWNMIGIALIIIGVIMA